MRSNKRDEQTTMINATATITPPVTPFTWKKVEPRNFEESIEEAPGIVRYYSQRLRADLLPGTFVLVLLPISNGDDTVADESRNSHIKDATVARIVHMGESLVPSAGGAPGIGGSLVEVNIFKRLSELRGMQEDFLYPDPLDENNLRFVPEVVQTQEIHIISSKDIINLAFVFTMESINDSRNLFSTCQGMATAYLLRYRLMSHLVDMPNGFCRPFPSSYAHCQYHDCFPSRMWRSVLCVKLETTKLLGRYSHQQGFFSKEFCRLSNFTAEAWGFLRLQFSEHQFIDGVSMRMRRHRVTESGLVVRALKVMKCCTVLRFETKAHLYAFCSVFGEASCAGQRCRLPRTGFPKSLWQNDIVNVVRGSDECEAPFNARTVRDGIDLEFDGGGELFITVRYRRFAYTANSIHSPEDCDELLSSLIHRRNPALFLWERNDDDQLMEEEAPDATTITSTIVSGSEFQDDDNGCLYRVVATNSTHVVAVCCYPVKNNDAFFGIRKSFEIERAKTLIEMRLN